MIPRLFTAYAWDEGTVVILLFWLGVLTIIPEFIKNYNTRKVRLSYLPNFTIATLFICFLISVSSFLLKDYIYKKESDGIWVYIRRLLYLLHPIISFAFISLAQNKIPLIRYIVLITVASGAALVLPIIISLMGVTYHFSKITAYTSAFFMQMISNETVTSIEHEMFFSNMKISVNGGCSAVPQFCLVIQGIFIFFICAPLKSLLKIILVLSVSFLSAFTLNSIRISILGFTMYKGQGLFDFWHSGLGSLIFSFIIMLVSSWYYYLFWCKENNDGC